MKESICMPVLFSFFISICLGPVVIPFLKNLKMRQTERTDGVKSHLKKAGTPTMGGIMILISVILTSCVYIKGHNGIMPVLLMTVGFGLIGFLDDYLKAVKKRSDGLFPWQKMRLQFLLTVFFAIYYYGFMLPRTPGMDAAWLIPFTGGKYIDLGFLAPVLMFPVIIGTVNGTNFTDGLDGLVSSVTLPVAAFFMAVAIMEKSGTWPVAAAVVGALLGFLVFNVYPARVFMGDTGSLALGGFVSSMAYMLRMPLFIVIVGLVYLVEVLSVIIQVTYFKKTGGKRIFKMAPIHHHFELCGWSESRVSAVFSVVTVILCLIAYMGYGRGI